MAIQQFKGLREGEYVFFDPQFINFEAGETCIYVTPHGQDMLLVHPSELFRLIDAVQAPRK